MPIIGIADKLTLDQIKQTVDKIYLNMSRRVTTVWSSYDQFLKWSSFNAQVLPEGAIIPNNTEVSAITLSPIISPTENIKTLDIVDFVGDGVEVNVVEASISNPLISMFPAVDSVNTTINTTQEVTQEFLPTEEYVSAIELRLKNSAVGTDTKYYGDVVPTGFVYGPERRAISPNGKWIGEIIITGNDPLYTFTFNMYELDPISGDVIRKVTSSEKGSYRSQNQFCLYWHPSGNWVVFNSYYTAYVYAFNNDTGVVSMTYKGQCSSMFYPSGSCWTPNGKYLIARAGDASPYIGATAFNESTGAFGATTNPGTLPGGTVSGIDVSYDGSCVVCSTAVSPYIHAYAFNQETGVWGAKSANPSPLASAASGYCKMAPDGTCVIFGLSASPFMYCYAFTLQNRTFGGNISISPTINQGVQPFSFNKQGDSFIINHTSTSYIFTYSSGVFSYIGAAGGTAPTFYPVAVNPFSPNNDCIYFAGYFFRGVQKAIITLEQGAAVHKRIISVHGAGYSNVLIPFYKPVSLNTATIRVKTLSNNLLVSKYDASTIAYKIYGASANQKLNCSVGEDLSSLDEGKNYRLAVNLDTLTSILQKAAISIIE